MMLVLSLTVAVVYSATTGSEMNAIRDDIFNLCHKAYGAEGGKHCRPVGESDSQRHVTYDCWNSGWSGKGALKCKYGVEAFNGAINKQGSGDNAVHSGVHGGRRRMEVVEEEEDVSDFVDEENVSDVFDEAVTEPTEESKWESKTHPVRFVLENIEDETEVMSLGNVSTCFLQGFEYIKPDDESVGPNCSLSRKDGRWQLSYASAKCNVVCFPHGASGMF